MFPEKQKDKKDHTIYLNFQPKEHRHLRTDTTKLIYPTKRQKTNEKYITKIPNHKT